MSTSEHVCVTARVRVSMDECVILSTFKFLGMQLTQNHTLCTNQQQVYLNYGFSMNSPDHITEQFISEKLLKQLSQPIHNTGSLSLNHITPHISKQTNQVNLVYTSLRSQHTVSWSCIYIVRSRTASVVVIIMQIRWERRGKGREGGEREREREKERGRERERESQCQ